MTNSPIPLIDLRCVDLANGDMETADRYARAQRWKLAVSKWKQRCVEVKAEAWRKGTPDDYTLPEQPNALRILSMIDDLTTL